MILRAAFWIAVVAVFMPHEPDLGYGRPSAGGFLPRSPSDWVLEGFKLPAPACADRETACSAGLASDLRGTILSNLDRVKAELRHNDLAVSEQRRKLGKMDD